MTVYWKGVYPAITTKFNKDSSLDLKTFNKNIQIQLDAGISGIVIAGSLGEASTLDDTEKVALLKSAVNVVGDEIPVIVNIAERTTQGAIKAAKTAKKHGASGLMILPPMQYKADDREVIAYFMSIADSTDLPIMLYNNPVDYGIEITLDMLEQLLKHENIQAIKESTRDLTNVTRMINRFGDDIKILCGVDTLAMEAMIMGAHGWVAGLVAAFPHETVAIYQLIKVNKIEEARELFRWFLPLLELDINPKLVQNIKLAEVATGLGTEYVRPPRLPLAGDERKSVQRVIDNALACRPKLSTISIQ